MLLSMTGFGKAVAVAENKKFTVEIKSLNSKQMDLNVRIPSSLREKELEIRNKVARILERGKADVVISVESIGEEAPYTINENAVKSYYSQIRKIAAESGIPEPADWFNVILRLPDVMHTETPDEVSDSISLALNEAVDKAVEALMQYRRAEGVKLEEFFAGRIKKITCYLSDVDVYEHQRVEKIRSRIEDGLSKIPVAEYDKGRLEQEMIFYIEKLDVNEEKQRLGQHLRYFSETMSLPNPGQGKKLGFIAQEMGREINTLGSKSNHAEMQKIVVKMKDELEQIKEQVLNVM